MALPLDLDTPVTAEVLTLVREGDRIVLTGPCGAAPWLIESGRDEHPLDTVRRVAAAALGDLSLLHSTSWRHERDSVVLTFVAVVADRAGMDGTEVRRVDLARSGATKAPRTIAHAQVIEHALRHLSWLATTDDTVRATLDPGWHELLAPYTPEPFRQLE